MVSVVLYLDKNDMSMVAMHWEHYFKHICQKYNKIYKVQMPKVTLMYADTHYVVTWQGLV